MFLVIKEPKKFKVIATIKGYSIKKLADKAELNPSFISRMINNQQVCNPANAKKISDVLEIEMPVIFDAIDNGEKFDLNDYILKGEKENETSRV